jgi:WD40 repeat protein
MLQLAGHSETVHTLAFAPDGRTLFSAGKDHTVRIWDVMAGSERAKIEGHAGAVLSLAVHPSGKLLASGAADKHFKLWQLPDGRPIEDFDCPKQMAAITGLGWLADRAGTLVMASGERMRPERGGELQLWNFNGKATARTIETDANGFWSLAVAPDPRVVAFGGGARRVGAWEMTRQKPRSFRLNSPSLAVALSPDGRLMASAVERTVLLFDVPKNREQAVLDGHKGLVRALAFAPSGRLLATGSQDQTVRFWSIHEAKAVPGPVYEWPIGGVHCLAFSPDGMLAAAGGDSGTIWVWDLDA